MSLINSILNIFVGDKSKKDIKEVEGLVQEILSYEEELSLISHDELRSRTIKFKEIISEVRKPFQKNIQGLNDKIENSSNIDEKEDYYKEIDKIISESDNQVEVKLNEILAEAFAVVKETAKRFKNNISQSFQD